ncbi:MAG: hypothetical protein IPN71_16455 [Fibrobacteres bacterium]|nr:hypothetical protein [Fibrobacterota bacterium]
MEKPDLEIFRGALGGDDPRTAVMVGMIRSATSGPHALGIATVHVEPSHRDLSRCQMRRSDILQLEEILA